MKAIHWICTALVAWQVGTLVTDIIGAKIENMLDDALNDLRL